MYNPMNEEMLLESHGFRIVEGRVDAILAVPNPHIVEKSNLEELVLIMDARIEGDIRIVGDNAIQFTLVSNYADTNLDDVIRHLQDIYDTTVQPLLRENSFPTEHSAIVNLLTLHDKIDMFEDDILNNLRDRYGVSAKWVGNDVLSISSTELSLVESVTELLQGFVIDPSRFAELLPLKTRRFEAGETASIIVGSKGVVIKYLQRELKVRIKSENRGGKVVAFTAESIRTDALDAFEVRLSGIRDNPEEFKSELKRIQNKKLHVFVDASNIMKGAQIERSGSRNPSIRLRVEKMIEIISNLRQIEHGVVIGSSPDRSSNFWKYWEDCRFDVHVFPHVNDNGKSVESGVDEAVQSAMLADICNDYNPRRTLVMLTGDGNDNHGRVSFPQVIERALRNEWAVEVWSWSASTSGIYQRYLNEYPGYISLHSLDEFRPEITFAAKAPQGHGAAEEDQNVTAGSNKHWTRNTGAGGSGGSWKTGGGPGGGSSGKTDGGAGRGGRYVAGGRVASGPGRSGRGPGNASKSGYPHGGNNVSLDSNSSVLLAGARDGNAASSNTAQSSSASAASTAANVFKEEITEELLCPILTTVMTDPVSCKCGHAFERSAIEDWLKRGNRTCPVSSSPLRIEDLTPSYVLRSIISKLESQKKK